MDTDRILDLAIQSKDRIEERKSTGKGMIIVENQSTKKLMRRRKKTRQKHEILTIFRGRLSD